MNPAIDFYRGTNPAIEFYRGTNPAIDFYRGIRPAIKIYRGIYPAIAYRGIAGSRDRGMNMYVVYIYTFLFINNRISSSHLKGQLCRNF
jgi:hypothetical protein